MKKINKKLLLFFITGFGLIGSMAAMNKEAKKKIVEKELFSEHYSRKEKFKILCTVDKSERDIFIGKIAHKCAVNALRKIRKVMNEKVQRVNVKGSSESKKTLINAKKRSDSFLEEIENLIHQVLKLYYFDSFFNEPEEGKHSCFFSFDAAMSFIEDDDAKDYLSIKNKNVYGSIKLNEMPLFVVGRYIKNVNYKYLIPFVTQSLIVAVLEEISEYVIIKKLYICSNELTEISKELIDALIKNGNKIKELYCSGNEFSKKPDVSGLKKLKVFHFGKISSPEKRIVGIVY